MGYLYGDLTPFPLDQNLIELIRDGIEMSASLLQADAAIENCREQVELEKAAAARHVEELHQMAGTIAEVLQPYLTRQDSPLIRDVSGRLVQAIRSVLEGAQGSLQSRRDSTAAAMESKIAGARGQALPALEAFLLRHELPETTWLVHWIGPQLESQLAEAQAVARAPGGLEARFLVEVPAGSPWMRMTRVADLVPNLTIQLPRKVRRGTALKPYELDRLFVTEANLGHEVTRVSLRRALKAGSPGLEVTWRGAEVIILALDDDSLDDGPIALEPGDATVMASLREAIDAGLHSLAGRRVRLVEARLGSSEVQRLDTPATLARLAIKVIAPFCREIIKRTPVPGELSLKRVVEDRRREEIFVKAADLIRLYASLPNKQRACFEELGLSAAEPVPLSRRPMPTGPVQPASTGEDGWGKGEDLVTRRTAVASDKVVISELAEEDDELTR